MKNLDQRLRDLVSDMDVDLKKRARQASREQQLRNERVKRIRRVLPDLQAAQTLAWKLPSAETKKKKINEAVPTQDDLLKRWARLHNIPANVRVNMENIEKVVEKLHIKQAKEKGLKKPARMRRPPKTLFETSPETIQGILPPIQQAFLRARLDRLGEGPVMKRLHSYQESEVRRRVQEAVKNADNEIDGMNITRREKAILKRDARQNLEKEIRHDHAGIVKAAVDNMIAQQTAARLPAAPKHKISLDQQERPRKKKKRQEDQRPSSIRFSWGSLRGSSSI